MGFSLSNTSPMMAELMGFALARDGEVAAAPDPEAAIAYLRSASNLDACDAKALSVFARRLGLKASPGDDPLLMAYLFDVNTVQAEEVARRYGAGEWGEDPRVRAEATAELLRILGDQLKGRQREIYGSIERPLQGILADMELRGIKIDQDRLIDLSETLAETLAEIESYVRKVAGDDSLNLNSRDQLAELLFDRLNLQPGRRTSTGKRSTRRECARTA